MSIDNADPSLTCTYIFIVEAAGQPLGKLSSIPDSSVAQWGTWESFGKGFYRSYMTLRLGGIYLFYTLSRVVSIQGNNGRIIGPWKAKFQKDIRNIMLHWKEQHILEEKTWVKIMVLIFTTFAVLKLGNSQDSELGLESGRPELPQTLAL